MDIMTKEMEHLFIEWNFACGCMYADKRARHDQFVTLEERFEDLLVRYGDTEEHRQGIRQSYAQGKAIERSMSLILGRDLGRENLG